MSEGVEGRGAGGARSRAGCQTEYTDERAARGCEERHEETGDLERATPCGRCAKPHPFHTRDCATGPKYCESCSAFTTHCAGEHCQNCYIDDYGFPTEDCEHCYAEIGGVLRISVEGSQLLGVEHLPTPDERHDLTPNPFED